MSQQYQIVHGSSDCCDSSSMGEIVDGWGICLSCRDHAFFPEEVAETKIECCICGKAFNESRMNVIEDSKGCDVDCCNSCFHSLGY